MVFYWKLKHSYKTHTHYIRDHRFYSGLWRDYLHVVLTLWVFLSLWMSPYLINISLNGCIRRYRFMFLRQKQYLSRSLRSLVRYCFCHSNIKSISRRNRVISSIYKWWIYVIISLISYERNAICLIDGSSYRLNFDLGKKNKIYHHS
jgi:hypothetical protein